MDDIFERGNKLTVHGDTLKSTGHQGEGGWDGKSGSTLFPGLLQGHLEFNTGSGCPSKKGENK